MKCILFLFIFFSPILLFGQSKQDIYCNPSITWAGIVDLDLVPAATSDQNWDLFKTFSMSNKQFKQQSKVLQKNSKTLADYVIDHANDGTLDFYEYDSLQYKKEFQSLELAQYIDEPTAYGEEGLPYSNSAFEVFTLRCLVYYDSKAVEFILVPQAVAVLRTEYDGGDSQAHGITLGWLPIQTDSFITSTWSKRYYRDIPLQDIKIFKQEWTTEQVFEQLLYKAQHTPLSIHSPQDLDGNQRFTTEEKEEMGYMEEIDFDPETYEEILVKNPFDGDRFTGINFTLDLGWDDHKKQLKIDQKAFTPIYQDINTLCDDCDQNKLHYLFTKKVK